MQPMTCGKGAEGWSEQRGQQCVLTTNPVSVSRRVRDRLSAGMLGMGAWWNRPRKEKGCQSVLPTLLNNDFIYVFPRKQAWYAWVTQPECEAELSGLAGRLQGRQSQFCSRRASLQKQPVLTGHQRFTHHSGSSSAQPLLPSCSFPNRHTRL